MKNYQVTAAIKEEKRLIKAITVEIAAMNAKKNATSSTIRSYRARYRYWRNNVAPKLKETQLDLGALNQAIKSYNDQLVLVQQFKQLDQATNLSQLIGDLDRLEQAIDKLKGFNLAVFDDELTAASSNMAVVRELIDHLVMTVQKSVDYFNTEIAHGSRILVLVTPKKLRIDEEAINMLVNTLLNQYRYSNKSLKSKFIHDDLFHYAQLDWDDLQESYNDGRLANVKVDLSSGIIQTAQHWQKDIEQAIKLHELAAHKPVKKNEVPISLPVVGHQLESDVQTIQEAFLTHLLIKMDNYTTGPYKKTEKYANDLNKIAAELGYGCPQIVFVDDTFNKTKLLRLLDDLEATFTMFGSQRNSAKGRTTIANFKNSIDNLRDVNTYADLTDAAEKFSRSSNLMIMWLTSNWWQNGGKPEGNAYLWKGKYARRLKKPK